MRSASIVLCILWVLDAHTLAQGISSQSPMQSKHIVIPASAVLDGMGQALHDTRIVIEGSKIVAIDLKAGPGDRLQSSIRVWAAGISLLGLLR
jgi:hypothetical protein